MAAGDFSARLTAGFTPDGSGPWTLTAAGAGAVRLFLDGEALTGAPTEATGTGPLGLLTKQVEASVELVAGTTYVVTAEVDAAPADGPIALTGLTVEARPPTQPEAVAPAAVSVHGPDTSGVKPAVSRAEKSPAATPGAGSPIQSPVASRTVSVRRGVPDRSPAGK